MHLKRLELKIMYRARSTNVTKHTAAVASHCEHNIARPNDAVAVYPNQRSDRCIPQRHGRCLSHSAVQSLHTPATWSLSIQPATQSLHIPFAAPSPHAYRCRCCFFYDMHTGNTCCKDEFITMAVSALGTHSFECIGTWRAGGALGRHATLAIVTSSG